MRRLAFFLCLLCMGLFPVNSVAQTVLQPPTRRIAPKPKPKPKPKPSPGRPTGGTANTRLSLSSTYADFDSDGGSKTFTVSSNKSWYISTDTYSWGHLSRSGNELTLAVDANTDDSPRTDYFEVQAGSKTVRVNISQDAASTSNSVDWSMTGTSRDYTDNASSLKYIREQIEEWGKCRMGSLTEGGSGVAINGDNGYAYTNINQKLADHIKELNNQQKRINAISITNSGYYCIVYDKNRFFAVAPPGMTDMLNKFYSDEDEILSVSISENGDYAIVTDKSIYASNSSDMECLQNAVKMYGRAYSACVTDKACCVVCENGVYYSQIPTNLEKKLKDIEYVPYFVDFTDSGTFLITTKSGKYYYYM